MQENSIFDFYRSQLFECSSCGKVTEHLLSSASKPHSQQELSPAKQYILENGKCWDKDMWNKFQIQPQAVRFTDVFKLCGILCSCLWIPITTAWRVLRLRMEEWPPIWRVAANKLNQQSRTADRGWSCSLGVGRRANNSSP